MLHISQTFNMRDIQQFDDDANPARAVMEWWRININPTVEQVVSAFVKAELILAADIVLKVFGLCVDVKTRQITQLLEVTIGSDEDKHDTDKADSPTALYHKLNNTELAEVTYKEICQLTNNFTLPQLGRGGFGVVSMGHCDSLDVAVKYFSLTDSNNKADLDRNNLAHKQFDAEVNFLTKVQHKHVIRLLGYCNEDVKRCLVYEYMHRGTLENCLQHVVPRTSLVATDRIRICIEVASALSHLHNLCPVVIHRDVKSANILLDVNLTAKLADFGLAHVGPSVNDTHLLATEKLGTKPYVSSEYWKRGEISVLLDAYSFGVVMLELLTGLPAYDEQLDEPRLADHAAELCKGDDLSGLLCVLDTRDGLWPQHVAVSMATTALRLTSDKKANRASVNEVLPLMQSWLESSDN